MPTQAERIASLEAHFANQTQAMQSMVRELEAHRQESRDGQEAMEARLLAAIGAALGSESDDGKGGQGLRGEVARLRTRVGLIERVGYVAAGVLFVVSLFASELITGIKSWLHLQ